METLRLKMTDITKTFPGVKALDRVQLNVKPGSVHALIGENGAGKSTLIKVLGGVYFHENGDVVIDVQIHKFSFAQDSIKAGVGIIYQEFNLVGDLSVAENIFLGRAIRKGMVIDLKAMERESKKILDSLNI